MRVVASFVVFFGILAACGGAAETNLFDEVPNNAAASSGSTSGNATSGTSGGSSGASGASGTSGTSGTGTSGASGCLDCGTTSSSSGNPIDAGPPGSVKCNTNAPGSCLPSEYCKTEACGLTGICTARPDPKSNLDPVCGCDHVTYWNGTIAGARGVNTAATGACGATGTTCTRNTGCTGDAVCDLEQATVCSVTEVKGTCWQLPKSCDGTNTRQVRRCTNQQCTSLCLAIADERQFVPGIGCP